MQGAALQSLLITDIVGSTRLWADHESHMAADLPVHDELVSTAITTAGGRVFKHTGDGMLATFESADASALAAAEITRRLAAHEWRVPGGIQVRVGLHSGSVHERNGDLFGPPVNRLARLLSKCPPEGVLVSEATAALLADGIPEGLSLQELGRVTLKDHSGSEAVHCLVGEGLLVVEPIEVIGSTGSLPPIDADLVGRSAEVSAVLDATASHSVVSIVGVGGMGKTRLALEAAAAAEPPDGAWWCDLTVASTPEAVAVTVLAALDASPTTGRSDIEAIVDHLSTRQALVVLDNCEHVVDATRELVDAMRRGAQQVRVLATSREALGLRGEHVIALSSLPATDAIGLFCTRALEARPDLDLDESTLEKVEEICVRLDGIPLAIELAAARCQSMTPAEIAARLDDRFRLLRGGRGGIERHRTLLATVEWSYSQLEEQDRALFDRLAVFAGGALIDAIAQVADVDEYDALDSLSQLIARSMVVATATPLGTRYRQLETLRQFALDRLVERDEIETIRDRHLGWAAAPALAYGAVNGTAAESEGLRRCIADVDNLRAAAVYAVASARPIDACRVLEGMGLWVVAIPLVEALDWLDPLTIPTSAWDASVAAGLASQAALAVFAGRADRTAELLAAVPDAWDDHPWVLTARLYEAMWATRDYELAQSLLDLAPPSALVDPVLHLVNTGHLYQTRAHADRAGDAAYVERALAHTTALVARMRQPGAELSLALALNVHGFVQVAAGDLLGSIASNTEAVELSQLTGAGLIVDSATFTLSDCLSRLALVEGADLDRSAALLRGTLTDAIQHRNTLFVVQHIGVSVERLLWSAGDLRTAALLGIWARRHATSWIAPTGIDLERFTAAELASIEAEAATLDVDAAAALALAALDRIPGSA